jgi:hypothetical protein
MLVDSQLEFSDGQAVTSTAISSNVIDLRTLGAGAGSDVGPNTTVDIGQGEDVYLVVQTRTAATDTSSDATLTITLESDSAVGLNSAPTVHFSTGALAFAAFSPAGTRLVTLKLPSALYQRYLGLRYTVASGPLTAGNFDAFLTLDPAGVRRTYASGFSVQ